MQEWMSIIVSEMKKQISFARCILKKKSFHNGYWKDYIKNTKCTLSIFSITWYL